MTITPSKVPPLPLSQNHRSSIKKSKDLHHLVDNFLHQNFEIQDTNKTLNNDASQIADPLENSKAFFESQINMLFTMIEHMKKLYAQKQIQNNKLKKMINLYGQKAYKQKSQRDKETINKTQNYFRKIIAKDENEKKTRKRCQNSENDIFKAAESAISQFESRTEKLDNFGNYKGLGKTSFLIQQSYETSEIKRMNQDLKHEIQQKNLKYEELRCELNKNQQILKRLNYQVKDISQQKQRFSLQYRILKQRYQTLERRYDSLQFEHGKCITQYELKLQNLRNVLRGIKQINSPRKLNQKNQEGYWSINRPLNKNDSKQSFASQSASQKSLYQSHIQINLKEQNSYLRDQLIKTLDEKGSLKAKSNKLQKQLKKIQNQNKAQIRHYESIYQNENDQNSENIQKGNSKSFKKNKNTSILIVQDTTQRQRQMLDQKKRLFLTEEILRLLQKLVSRIEVGHNSNYNKCQKIWQLQGLIKRLKIYTEEQEKLKMAFMQLKEQNQKLKKEKWQIERKSQDDINQLRSFLRQITENSSQVKSSDSTDKAFKNICLTKSNELINENQQKNELGNYCVYKQKDESKMKNEKLRQVQNFNEQPYFTNQASQSIYKLTNQSQYQSQLNIVLSKNTNSQNCHLNQNVSIPCSQNQRIFQLSHFELFKQKLTQFYQQTIKELDDWQIQTLKNVHSSSKQYIQIENHFSNQIQIPSYQILHRNVLRTSQQLKTIRQVKIIQNSQSDVYDNDKKNSQDEFFKQKKMTKSFIASQEAVEDMINKRFEEFQKYSSALIYQYVNAKKNSSQTQLKSQNQECGFAQNQCQVIKRKSLQFRCIQSSKTQRLPIQNDNLKEVLDIDARSQSVSSSQLMKERQLFIREEISYYANTNQRLNNLLLSSNSKKSYQSSKIH